MPRKGKLGNAPGSDQHFTPSEILDRVEMVDHIGMDPCSHPRSEAYLRAEMAYTEADGYAPNDLRTNWHPAGGLIWLNPPFSSIEPWVNRLVYQEHSLNGHPAIVLVPCRTSQDYFGTLLRAITHGGALAFWRGTPHLELRDPNYLSRRVRFLDGDGERQAGAPFDTAIFLLTRDKLHTQRFQAAFGDVATVVTPSRGGHPVPNVATPTERVKGQGFSGNRSGGSCT